MYSNPQQGLYNVMYGTCSNRTIRRKHYINSNVKNPLAGAVAKLNVSGPPNSRGFTGFTNKLIITKNSYTKKPVILS